MRRTIDNIKGDRQTSHRQLWQFMPAMAKISQKLATVTGETIGEMPEEPHNSDAQEAPVGENDPAAKGSDPRSVADGSSARSGTPLWILGMRVFALFFIGTAIYATIAFPKLIETSDYLSAFYVAGKAVLSGHPEILYPTSKDADFHSLAFNQLAHQVLPNLTADKTAIYMYSPANALLFAPFAILGPVASMIAWQVVSLISALGATVFVCRLKFVSAASLCRRSADHSDLTAADADKEHADRAGTRIDDAFFAVFLFLPVIHTLLIGQLGLLVGLLPAAAAIWFLLRRKDLISGFCFSLLLLKPHFMPIAMLVAGALALNRRWNCAIGLASGCLAIVAISTVLMTPDIWLSFLRSFSMTDTFFSNPSYGVPLHLVACVPGALMQAVAAADRQLVKIITYAVAALCGLHALYVCTGLFRRESYERAVLLTVMVGILTLPIVIPHLLFYDLCMYALAGLLIFSLPWPRADKFVLCVWAAGAWILLDFYYLLAVSGVVRAPLVMVAVLLVLLILLYARMVKFVLRD